MIKNRPTCNIQLYVPSGSGVEVPAQSGLRGDLHGIEQADANCRLGTLLAVCAYLCRERVLPCPYVYSWAKLAK